MGEGSGRHGYKQSRMIYLYDNVTTKAIIPTLKSSDDDELHMLLAPSVLSLHKPCVYFAV